MVYEFVSEMSLKTLMVNVDPQSLTKLVKVILIVQ